MPAKEEKKTRFYHKSESDIFCQALDPPHTFTIQQHLDIASLIYYISYFIFCNQKASRDTFQIWTVGKAKTICFKLLRLRNHNHAF